MRVFYLILVLIISGCATISPSSNLRAPDIQSHKPISNYMLAIITDGDTIISHSKSMDPDVAIAGVLLKKGITRIYKIPETNKDKSVLVTWGISGSRDIGLMGAYSQEVTILIRQMSNMEIVYKCTAEGLGSTDVDDIRNAIYSCLSEL